MKAGHKGGWVAMGLGVGMLLAGARQGLAQEPASVGQTTISIGRVSDNPKKHYPRCEAIVTYLAKELSSLGIREGKVVLAKTNQELIEKIKAGEVDLITETPFSSFLYEELAGTKILLRRWKKGSAMYHSVIFTRKDSRINRLEDLKGRKIAFEDPGSTSSYLLPRARFKQLGIPLVELKSFTDPVPPDKVGYLFSWGEVNMAHWVHKGLADAGALSNEEFLEADEVPEEFLPDFKVIFESIQVPRNLISYRPGLDPRLVEAVKRILLDAKKTEAGRRAMHQFGKTSNFDELFGGSEAALASVRELYQFLRGDILSQ